MNDLDRQTQYASNQHDLACVALGISFDIKGTGGTLLEAVRALLKDRNNARIQRDKAEDQLASERALADQLAAIVQRSRDGHGGMLTDPECFCDDCEHLRVLDAALNRWKEARK